MLGHAGDESSGHCIFGSNVRVSTDLFASVVEVQHHITVFLLSSLYSVSNSVSKFTSTINCTVPWWQSKQHLQWCETSTMMLRTCMETVPLDFDYAQSVNEESTLFLQLSSPEITPSTVGSILHLACLPQWFLDWQELNHLSISRSLLL